MRLVTGGDSGTLFAPLPLRDLVWVLLVCLRLGSSLFVLPSPLCWVLCFMELARVSSSLIILLDLTISRPILNMYCLIESYNKTRIVLMKSSNMNVKMNNDIWEGLKLGI